MNTIVQTHKKAIELRRLGYSYGDISKQLKVSRTSVANWVKNVRLSENEKLLLQKNLKAKVQRARLNASITIRSRKIFKEKRAFENAEKDFKKYLKDPLFTLASGLYWAKGSVGAGNIQFASSDPVIVNIILVWLKKYLNIDKNQVKYRIFGDSVSKNLEYQEFWEKTLGISANNFQKNVHNRHHLNRARTANYKGSLAITLTKIEAVRTIIAWQKLLMQYYRG
ncbi:MAG: hypothetical protein AAB917_01285 [Patescibacteria group bacterium]